MTLRITLSDAIPCIPTGGLTSRSEDVGCRIRLRWRRTWREQTQTQCKQMLHFMVISLANAAWTYHPNLCDPAAADGHMISYSAV